MLDLSLVAFEQKKVAMFATLLRGYYSSVTLLAVWRVIGI